MSEAWGVFIKNKSGKKVHENHLRKDTLKVKNAYQILGTCVSNLKVRERVLFYFKSGKTRSVKVENASLLVGGYHGYKCK